MTLKERELIFRNALTTIANMVELEDAKAIAQRALRQSTQRIARQCKPTWQRFFERNGIEMPK